MWPVTIERQPLSAKTNTPRCRLSRSTTVLQRTLYTSTHPWKRQHAVRLLCRHTYICVESPPTLHSTSNLIAFSIQASGCFCLPSCRAFRASLQSYTSDRTTIPLHLSRPNRTSDPTDNNNPIQHRQCAFKSSSASPSASASTTATRSILVPLEHSVAMGKRIVDRGVGEHFADKSGVDVV
jgi:hypothetical protein